MQPQILVYMVLYGKGYPTGCGLDGYSSIQYCYLFLNNTFFPYRHCLQLSGYIQALFTTVKLYTGIVYNCQVIYRHCLQLSSYIQALFTTVKLYTGIVYNCQVIYRHCLQLSSYI